LKKQLHALAAIALALGFVFANAGTARAATKIKTAATFTIIQDIAKNIAGDLAEVDVIVPADSDAHDYEPQPTDAQKLADAKLIFANGALFEGFIDKLISTSGTKATVVNVSKGVQIKKFAEPDESAEKAEFLGVSGEYECQEPKEGEEAGDCDPHFWQNPLNVVKYAENIRDALIAADAANKDGYTKNAAAYIEKLQKLDKDIRDAVKAIPEANRVIVTSHDALGYFAAEYGFTVAGVILPGGAAGAITEPDPKAVADLIDSLKTRKIKAIFVENIASDKLARQIAEQAGVKVVTGLYTDALGEKDSPGATYLGMMEANLKAFQDALTK
jgi:zinc/manganese transport system substrate-binding protein